MYKIIRRGTLCHASATIDDDGRWHSPSNGQFVRKPASELSNDELSAYNKRANLEKKYNENFPTKSKQVGDMFDATSKGLNNASNVVRNVRLKEKKNPRADLSKLSDNELRQILNREQMERQYDQFFNTPTESKGQKFVNGLATGLSIAGGVAGLAVAATTIYSTLIHKDTIL